MESETEATGLAAAPDPEMEALYPAKRPTGRMVIGIGIAMLAIGGLLWFIGMSPGGRRYDGSIDPAALLRKARLLAISVPLSWAGLAVLLTGLVIRAIWFLPGDDERKGLF